MAEHASPGVSVVVDEVFDHPEGLLWDARQGRLLWVDIFAGLVLSDDLAAGPMQKWEIGRAVGAVAPRQGDGGLVCAVREGFGFLSAQGEFSLVTDQLRDRPYLQMNDGAVDASGRFWAGTTCLEPEAYPGAGTLYCLDPVTLKATEQLSGIDVSNGIGWSPDGRRCYYIDSARAARRCVPVRRRQQPATGRARDAGGGGRRTGRACGRLRGLHLGSSVRWLGGAPVHAFRAA